MDEDEDRGFELAVTEESAEGSFSRNYTTYGLLVVMMLCAIWLWEILYSGICLILVLLVFFISEFDTHRHVKAIVANENNRISIPKYISLIITSITLSIFCYSVYKGVVSFGITQKLTFIIVYSHNLYFTLSIVFMFQALQQLFILTGFAKHQIRQGLLGLIYRIIIIFRSIVVTNSWIKYWANDEVATFNQTFLSQKPSSAAFYLAAKALFIAQLFWDLDLTRRHYAIGSGALRALTDPSTAFASVFCCF